VRCEASGLEYNGTSLNALFAQRTNLLRPRFLAMVRDILRFNREAPRLLDAPGEPSLAEYVQAQGYSRAFAELYLAPMAAAIWSADPRTVLDGPARFFIRFFRNHGMLSVNRRPTWRTLRGGSSAYLAPLTRPFARRIRTGTPARAIQRRPRHVLVNGERFDAVVLACHSDEALRAIADPSAMEREVLGAIRYQENEAVLHTDARLLPRRRLAWAAWNYHIPRAPQARVALTYNMNILQRLAAPETLCVTLNHGAHIDPARVIARMTYHHPVMDGAAVRAQARHAEVSKARTYFCGAYWGNGFHEDGIVSAHAAVAQLERDYDHDHAQLPLLRAG
jgi:predicted NAD/FAD-binding protein